MFSVWTWASSASWLSTLGVRSPDPRAEFGGAGLGDLMAETALHFLLEAVPLVAGAEELGPGVSRFWAA
jgi:hypothetical protein